MSNLIPPESENKTEPQLDLEPTPVLSSDEASRLSRIEPRCEHCGQRFEPRNGGGSKQRFCSSDCRKRAHAGLEPPVHSVIPSVAPSVNCAASDAASDADDDEFNWGAEDVVIVGQAPTAVFRNAGGGVTTMLERRSRC